MNIEEWFLRNARVTRGAATRLAEVSREELDIEADELELGARLSLEQLVELLEALEELDDDDADDMDDGDEAETVEG